MHHEERDQFAENWLNKALTAYSANEPRPGLQFRIAASVSAQRDIHARRLRWFVWTPLTATAAVVLLLFGASLLRSHRGTTVTAGIATTVPPSIIAQTPIAATASSRPTTPRPAKHTRSIRGHEARRPQFPSAAPLSEQERLLLQYARLTPSDEILRFAETQQQRRDELDRLTEQKDNSVPAEHDLNQMRQWDTTDDSQTNPSGAR